MREFFSKIGDWLGSSKGGAIVDGVLGIVWIALGAFIIGTDKALAIIMFFNAYIFGVSAGLKMQHHRSQGLIDIKEDIIRVQDGMIANLREALIEERERNAS